MEKEQLKYFLKTGRLKSVDYQVTRSKLMKNLGKPNWLYYSFDEDKLPSLYKYGRFEFHFIGQQENDTLDVILYNVMADDETSEAFVCDYHHWTNKLSLNEAIIFLRTNDILFEEETYPHDDETKLIVTEGNVHILFDSQSTPGHYYLYKASSSADDNH